MALSFALALTFSTTVCAAEPNLDRTERGMEVTAVSDSHVQIAFDYQGVYTVVKTNK